MMRDLLNIYGRFEALWSKYRKWVWYWCYTYVRGDVDIAGDFSQEVAIAIMGNINSLDINASTREEFVWVRKVTRTTLGRHSRSAKIELTRLTEELERTIAEENNEAAERIKELMAYLPDKDRQFLQMYLDGYSYSDIAAKCEMSDGAVRQNFFRIKQKIKDIDIKINEQ